MNNKTHAAFTLIELLVVIAIISLLAALLLPVISRGKQAAQRINCVSKLRQWVLATQSYASDNRDLLPREDAQDGINPWVLASDPGSADVWYNAAAEEMPTKTVAQYARNPLSGEFYASRSMFRCPSALITEANSVDQPIFSLVINSQLMKTGEHVRISAIEQPSQTALYLDCGVPEEKNANEKQAEYTGQPKAFANRFPVRHALGGNIAMADGRVSHFAASKVVNPVDGRDIFPPRDVIWSTRADVKP
jgi:prepilin-type N-terminal cleavage/methylation domain-containing protein/prepilin-type processing-associated H-X9-DG protein